MTTRKTICIVATVPFVINWFMKPHILSLRKDYNITLVSSGPREEIDDLLCDNVVYYSVHINRKITLLNDMLLLIHLFRYFKKHKFDCVQSIMPKSGLLAMLAARMAKIPIRVHIFTGQIWVNKKGLNRLIFKTLDRILVANSTQVLADSKSQRAFLIKNNIAKPSSITVLADGSIAGVNENRFKYSDEAKQNIRQELKIENDAIVFLFLGRLKRDKGLLDLAEAFSLAAKNNSNIHLLIVGPDEEGIDMHLARFVKNYPGKVHRVGKTKFPEKYMSASDVLCLPSYREGFGMVIIEAAAIGLPAIASRIYGITDAVIDGVTGILHQPASKNEISDAMSFFASNTTIIREMGVTAQKRVLDKFTEAKIVSEFIGFYNKLLTADMCQKVTKTCICTK